MTTAIPIVCLGCNERAVIPFLPPDLTCVACKTGEHIDLDDGLEVESALGDPDLPMMLLPQGTPDQDQDMALYEERDSPRKVILPEGSPPYSQRALGSKTADSWNHGGGQQVYSCYLDADCPVVGTAAEMEKHYATNHLDSANRALLANPQRTKVAINKIADFATVIASLGACNGTRVNVVYSSDFKGVTTVSGMLTYASGHATVQTPDGLVDIPASQVLAVDKVGYADFPDQRTDPTGNPSVFDYVHVGPSTVASKTAATDGDTSTCKNCEQPIEYAETAWVHTPSYSIRCTGGDGRVTQVANTVAEPKTASKQALSYEDDDAYDEGFEDGITGAPMATGLAAYVKGYEDGQAAKSSKSLVLSKLLTIAAAVTETNPGMPGRTALRVARKTLERYPKVASDDRPNTDTIPCPKCGEKMTYISPADGWQCRRCGYLPKDKG